jgi:hypothetical protein
MFQPDFEPQWRKIKKVELCPEIVSFEQYTALYTEQLASALEESRRIALLVLRDGNTRTAVVILEGQIRSLFGQKIRPPLAGLDFKQLLRAAYQGNPSELANRILAREGVATMREIRSVPIRPKLDVDMETEWQKNREEILKKQRGQR